MLRIRALHLPIQSAHTHTSVNTLGAVVNISAAGDSVLAQGHLVVVLKVERALYIHSPDNPCRNETRTHDLSIMSPTH